MTSDHQTRTRPSTNLVAALLLSGAGTAVAELHGRLPVTPGGLDYQAYYDDQLDITWAAQIGATGLDTWSNQAAWASSLTINGVDGWRLPNMDVNNDGVIVHCFGDPPSECLDNEIGYLVWVNGITPATPAPFSWVGPSGIYWSGTPQQAVPGEYWQISISTTRGIGGISWSPDSVLGVAWAVHDGDVVQPSPSEMISQLVDKIISLNLRAGLANSLDRKLDAALQALENANSRSNNIASNMLHAFIYNVEAQRGNRLTTEQADELIADAQMIIANL